MRAATVAELFAFDEIIDVRSPAEFAEDHVPGAISLPVLDDAERARVGTLYKQVSPFEAKKTGAALIARNIATHLETHFADRPKNWRPLVYCWRGGNRSGAMTHILARIGFAAVQLDGGYKAYRRHVLAALDALPATLDFRVICGATGSGKSRLLAALGQAGAQVLDLEALARHRGSLLGALPGAAQPAQKGFESALWHVMSGLDPRRPVFVEAESRKIGALTLPAALLEALHRSPCVRLVAPLAARVSVLLEDYAHFLTQPEALIARLAHLAPLHGHTQIAEWTALARAGQWDTLTATLLTTHYDPAYQKSLGSHYPPRPDDLTLDLPSLDAATLHEAARALVAQVQSRRTSVTPSTH